MSHGMFMEDKLGAECVVNLAPFNEFLNDSYFTMRPFGRFVQACHDTPAVRVKILPWRKRLFEYIEGLDQTSQDDSELQTFFKSLMRPSQTWVRKIMVTLAETEWHSISPLVLRKLLEVPSGQL